tara:strand:+ start:6160 stop:6336 length:177 start_codon:yes stop_codon:yes gene_type:complete
MRIKVKYRDIEIEVSEDGHSHNDRQATMRFSDQNKQIQDTIKVMTEQVLKLKDLKEQK